MSKLIIGFILGLVVSAVGFSGMLECLTKAYRPSKLRAGNWPSKTGKSNLNYSKKWLTQILFGAII